ncbi:MAG: glycosyltransferase, partial [Acidobacteria bacterium]|nr:glycosyltransferase [Acidobacteriota bacterium]
AAYVVPLRIGGGTRLKIYEAMAMEKPIISTTIGAEGLPVQNGEHLLLADTPQAFAAECVRVLKDEDTARELGSRAAKIVREQFGWDKVAANFAELCQRAVRLQQPERTKSQVEEELPTVV